MKFAFVFMLMAPLLFADPLAETQARFGVITGDVGLLTQGAPEWIEPHEGLPIETGDHIRTGEDGRAEVLLSENVVWMLEPESDLLTERMDTNSGRFNLSSGTLRGAVDSARVAGVVQTWDFSTPAAMVFVHGTQFALIASKARGTRLGVFEGTVGLGAAETAEGLQPPVQVLKGQEAVALRGRAVKIVGSFSSPMRPLADKAGSLRRRQIQIENTWSPFTTTVRKELRLKYVAPLAKTTRAKPRPKPVRRSKSAPRNENQSSY